MFRLDETSSGTRKYSCAVRSHNGNAHNEQADALAISGTRKALPTSEPKRRKKTPDVVPKGGVSSVELPSEENKDLGSSNTHKVQKKQHKGTKKELNRQRKNLVGIRMKFLKIQSYYNIRKGCFLNWF